MAEELLPTDLESYGASDETARALAAALARARRYCDWHVSPQREETLTLDGTGDCHLSLPTRCVVSIDGVTVAGDEVTDYVQPAHASHMLIRETAWPKGYSNISVTLTHGYTAEEAADFRGAVLLMASEDLRLAEDGGGHITQLTVDDVSMRWARTPGMDPGIAAALDPFRRKWFAV